MNEFATTRIYWENAAAQTRLVINIGGARSSKSHSIAQLLITRAIAEPGLRAGITRKTMAAQHNSSYQLFISLLKRYGLYESSRHDRTHCKYSLGESLFTFFGMEDLERLKSTEFNVIWMEEANEFTWDDYILLSTRLSGAPCAMPLPAPENNISLPRAEERESIRGCARAPNQLYMSLNPSDADGWIATKLLRRGDATVIRSNYLDNEFLSPEYIGLLEGLREQDENAWRIFTLGEWGESGARIYANFGFADKPPDNPDETFYGLDFGFNNPCALVRCDLKDNALYADELLYETGLTNAALATRLERLIPPDKRNRPVYADAAEPARIAELGYARFNVLPADKSVLDGIGTLNSRRLIITRRSENLIREIQNYRWRRDRDGKTLDEPVKFNDHLLDALRYAARTHLKPLPPQPEFRMTILE